MAPPDAVLDLRLEKVRMLWDYASQEVDAHRQRYLQLFAVFVAGGLASAASVVLSPRTLAAPSRSPCSGSRRTPTCGFFCSRGNCAGR